MTNLLTRDKFQSTFAHPMKDVTKIELTDPIYIWDYVKEIPESDYEGNQIVSGEIVEEVRRSGDDKFDHILVPCERKNVYLVIVIDLKNSVIFGHKILDLNKEYGIEIK